MEVDMPNLLLSLQDEALFDNPYLITVPVEVVV